MRVEGTTALITGASRGLGAALARALAREGARVVLVARGGEDLERVAAEIRAAGGEAHAIAADVADKEAVYPLAGTAAALAGPVDILIQNASTLGSLPMRYLLDTACEDLAQVLEVNLMGPFRLAKALVGPMVLRGKGLVLDVSSDAAVAAYPRWGAYGVSKAALDHLGRIFAAELEGTGVRFLTVDPGEMNTRMHADAMPEADTSQLRDPAEVAQRIVAMIREAETIPGGSRLEAMAWTASVPLHAAAS